MMKAWQGDWYERIIQRVRDRGFETVTAFGDAWPTTSLMSMADELGKDDVAAAQLERMLVLEAEETGNIRQCARSLLLRRLHEELPEGWHAQWDDDSLFRRASAFSGWTSGLGERYKPGVYHVWDALIALPIPEGWLPADRDDAFILEAFKHWETPT